jgi:hypothetical protein
MPGRDDQAIPGGMRPLVRDYSFLALGALAVCGMILYFEGPGAWGLLPVLIGVVGVLLRWNGAPGLYLVALMPAYVLGLWGYPSWYRFPAPGLTDFLLGAASLVYIAAQMRLLTLTRYGVPPDPRRQRRPPGRRVTGRWFLPAGPSGRSAALTGAGELMLLLAGAVVFTLVALLLAINYLNPEISPGPSDISPQMWHIFVVFWGLVVALAGAYAFLSYLGRATAGPQESTLYLQDQLWAATRREHGRINRWLVWARLRRQQKEERS